VPGLVVYRFGTSLYFANASRFVEDVITLTRHGDPLRWLVLDFAAIGDVDYTASSVLSRAFGQLHEEGHIHVVTTSLVQPVRDELQHYGLTGDHGPDGFYDTPGAALAAFHAAGPG